MSEKKPTRKGNTPIYVWMTPDEKSEIEAQAQATGHSTSAFLRLVGLGYPVRASWTTSALKSWRKSMVTSAVSVAC